MAEKKVEGIRRLLYNFVTFGQYELWQYFMRKKARIDKGPKDETMIANLKNLKNHCTKEGHHVVIELSTPASYSEEEKYYFLTIRNNKKFKKKTEEVLGILISDGKGTLITDEKLVKENIITQLARSTFLMNQYGNKFTVQRIRGNLEKLSFALARLNLLNKENAGAPVEFTDLCESFERVIADHNNIIDAMEELEDSVCWDDGPELGCIAPWKKLESQCFTFFEDEFQIIKKFKGYENLSVLWGNYYDQTVRILNENIFLMNNQVSELGNVDRYIHDTADNYFTMWKDSMEKYSINFPVDELN
tara:strand:- start:1282 stop:2193 length:912 start_codon:yes stop_codon:yes gene_type:complete